MVELGSIRSSPSCTVRTPNSVVELMALSKAMALATCRCQHSHLPMLVDWFGDPLGVRTPSDSLMEWINEGNLKEFVCGIVTNPVRIQDPQSPTVVLSSLLSNRLKASGKLQLVITMIDRFVIGRTLGNRVFEATTAHTNPVCDITLLGLVSQPTLFIRPGGVGGPMELRDLAVLPAAHHEKEAHHIGLLLPPKLLDVLVCKCPSWLTLWLRLDRKEEAFSHSKSFLTSGQDGGAGRHTVPPHTTKRRTTTN